MRTILTTLLILFSLNLFSQVTDRQGFNQEVDEWLTFFSDYMHLAEWDEAANAHIYRTKVDDMTVVCGDIDDNDYPDFITVVSTDRPVSELVDDYAVFGLPTVSDNLYIFSSNTYYITILPQEDKVFTTYYSSLGFGWIFYNNKL